MTKLRVGVIGLGMGWTHLADYMKNPAVEVVAVADRREDRMILFADLTDQELVYTYRIRAVNRGSFTVPPIHAEAMYDQSLYGHSAAGNMEIH